MGSEPHLYMSSALLCPLHFIADMSLEESRESVLRQAQNIVSNNGMTERATRDFIINSEESSPLTQRISSPKTSNISLLSYASRYWY